MTSENEIKHGLLAVCKVKGWDGDFNILGFHVLCDKLKQLGAEEEREACANTAGLALLGADKALSDRVLKAIRARGNT